MEKNEKIEVSFVTDKQLWMDLKALCSKKKEIFKGLKTPKFGHRFLIKDAATEAIRNYVHPRQYFNDSLKEYRVIKERYKTMKIGFILLATSFVLFCTANLLKYLGV
jgi:hypothetical protein